MHLATRPVLFVPQLTLYNQRTPFVYWHVPATTTRRMGAFIDQMKESVFGFIQEGEWVAIVEHGERISAALNSVGIDGESFEEWNEWRPKAHERINDDIIEKTAEQASVSRGDGERAGALPDEDVRTAGKELSDATNNIIEGEINEAISEGKDAVTYAARAVDSAGRKAIRAAEEPVYKHVMTQVSPCYFDNELISANVSRIQDNEKNYVFEVNIVDDELKEQISEQLAAYEEEIDRWRIETEKNTRTVAATEGVDMSE